MEVKVAASARTTIARRKNDLFIALNSVLTLQK
jgi:hypothetical protein